MREDNKDNMEFDHHILSNFVMFFDDITVSH